MTAPPIPASYTPSSSVLGRNLQTARSMLAACASVQTLFGAADSDEAAERIYIGCLPRPSTGDSYTLAELNQYRPFALIGPAPTLAMRMRLETFGSSWSHGRQGEFDIMLERQHPDDGSDDISDLEWLDIVSAVAQSADADSPGLAELHEREGMLSLRMIEVLDVYRGAESELKDLGDYQRAMIRIHWGRV